MDIHKLYDSIPNSLVSKVVRIMETVFNLDGNFNEIEILQTLDSIRHLTIDDLDEIDSLELQCVDLDAEYEAYYNDDDDDVEHYHTATGVERDDSDIVVRLIDALS